MQIIPTILAVDTAAGGASVSVSHAGSLFTRKAEGNGIQAEQLFGLISSVMNEAAINPSQLTALACSIGPGSFTGVRIGLSALKGIELGLGIPLYGVSNLEIIAFAASKTPQLENFSVMLDAKRGAAYVQRFSLKNGLPSALSDAQETPYTELDNTLPVFTNQHGWLPFAAEVLEPGVSITLAELIEKRIQANQLEAYLNPLPLYIRPPDAKLPSKQSLWQN